MKPFSFYQTHSYSLLWSFGGLISLLWTSNCFATFSLIQLIIDISDLPQIDMTALKQMGENDLKELGIPMVFTFSPFSVLFLLICFINAVQLGVLWLCCLILHN